MQRFWPADFGVPFGNASHSKSSELIISRPRVRRLFLNLGPRERRKLPFRPVEEAIADRFWDLRDRHAKHFGSQPEFIASGFGGFLALIGRKT